jgi:glucose-6-phosphate-specific signal transduction histidine kinase
VTAACADEVLLVEVSDDGIGGAVAPGGSGLRGLADRIEAIGGTIPVPARWSGHLAARRGAVPLALGAEVH